MINIVLFYLEASCIQSGQKDRKWVGAGERAFSVWGDEKSFRCGDYGRLRNTVSEV